MEPGQQISTNLRLVRILGQGGMGSVWIADHLSLGTQVAVKVMSRAVSAEPMFVERFRREAAAAAQLKSPHVAQVFDHGVSAGGEPFIVMELLEGEDLGKRIERTGPQPYSLVIEVVAQAAKALGRAHQLGIIHRDIKADNLFLSENDGDLLVKVLDFGIAKTSLANVSVTSTGGTFGTPLFMSPEQLLSAKHVDAGADLWSLAVVAYFALTAHLPFEGETLGAISVAVHAGHFTPPSKLRSGLSASVDAWFVRAFKRQASERFSSAREMAETLRAGLATSSSTVSAMSAPGPAARGSSPSMGQLPTVDSITGQARASSPGGPVGGPTLGGAMVPGAREPRRRTALLAVAGLLAGMTIAMVVLRPWQSGPDAPVKDPASPAATSVPSPVSVVPSASASASASAGATAGPKSAEPHVDPAPVVDPAPLPTSTARASGSSPATPRGTGGKAAVAAPPKASTAPTTKKDDIGF